MLSFLYLVSMLFADLLSLHLVTFLMFFILVVYKDEFASQACFVATWCEIACDSLIVLWSNNPAIEGGG